MTYIEEPFRKIATVERPYRWKDAFGTSKPAGWVTIINSHVVDKQPIMLSADLINHQLQFKASHRVFPENYLPALRVGDYYNIGGNRLRITKKYDYSDTCYVDVYDGSSEKIESTGDFEAQSVIADNVTASSYTYGSGIFETFTAGSTIPNLFFSRYNDSSFYLGSHTVSGFDLVDLGLGETPSLSVYVQENLNWANIWKFTLGPGSYTYGSGVLASTPTFSTPPAVIGTRLNDGDYFIKNPTSAGFEIVDKGLGSTPSVLAYIIPANHPVFDVKLSLSAGVYKFGEGDLLNSPIQGDAPLVLSENNNDGDHFIKSVDYDGFTIKDKGLGDAPNVSVVIVPR